MLPQSNKAFPFAILFVLVFSACATLIPPTPTAIPTSTATAVDTATPLPTHTPIPTATKAAPCDADQTIKNLKSRISYQEFVVLYNQFKGTASLVVWFVDPDIDPAPGETEIAENGTLAMRHAMRLTEELNAADGCVGKLFDKINPIVVDTKYHGWFSGQVSIDSLPAEVETDETQLDETASLFEVGYLRKKLPAKSGSAPANSCTWPETKSKIQQHFSPERQNVAFYFVLDEAGVNVWAQWDSSQSDFALAIVSLLNIAMELDCLHPRPDRIIFSVVDEAGETQMLGIWNGSDAEKQDITQIQIIFQK